MGTDMSKVTVLKSEKYLKIYLEDKLHLQLNGKLIGFQSWITDSSPRLYSIQFYLKNKDVKTEYVDVKTWHKILKALDK